MNQYYFEVSLLEFFARLRQLDEFLQFEQVELLE